MCDMYPTSVCLDGGSSRTVFGLGDGVIFPQAGHALFVDDCMGNVVAQSEPDSSAASGLDEVIHRSGVKSIFAIHEFRMQHYISLLGRTKGL